MFVWILVLSPWVGLISLILHDATKEDSEGSAISIAAKNFKAIIFWTVQKGLSRLPTKVAFGLALAPPPKMQWWRKERRVSMTTTELESAISEAVKKAAPGCEAFVGVIVRHETPKSHLDANWAIRGVRFGNADKKLANEILATVVERMKQEFLLSDD
jgi:hypothetical protein